MIDRAGFIQSNRGRCLFLVVTFYFFSCTSFAQDSAIKKSNWQFLLHPYLMFPNMNGTTGIGQLPDAEVNANADDIFSKLQFGAMLYAEAYNDRWAITSDIIYMDLSQAIEGKRGIVRGAADVQQLVWELAGLRKLDSWLEAGIGFRLYNIESRLDMDVDSTVLGGGGHRSANLTKTWVDPIVITRFKFPAGTDWLFQVRADIGGFGLGSEFSWQLQGDVAYRISKLFGLMVGYRIIGVDYENGTGNDRFLYDVNTFGPVIRLAFHF